jgi:hypothetical protein
MLGGAFHNPKRIDCLLDGACKSGGFAGSLQGRIYGVPDGK